MDARRHARGRASLCLHTAGRDHPRLRWRRSLERARRQRLADRLPGRRYLPVREGRRPGHDRGQLDQSRRPPRADGPPVDGNHGFAPVQGERRCRAHLRHGQGFDHHPRYAGNRRIRHRGNRLLQRCRLDAPYDPQSPGKQGTSCGRRRHLFVQDQCAAGSVPSRAAAQRFRCRRRHAVRHCGHGRRQCRRRNQRRRQHRGDGASRVHRTGAVHLYGLRRSQRPDHGHRQRARHTAGAGQGRLRLRSGRRRFPADLRRAAALERRRRRPHDRRAGARRGERSCEPGQQRPDQLHACAELQRPRLLPLRGQHAGGRSCGRRRLRQRHAAERRAGCAQRQRLCH
ncbi:hypothetical protein FQZ97_678880 [compost metagenome]